MTKRSNSQWTAQFLAAAELARRDYLVTFTMGNHTPLADMLVRSPSGKAFAVDAKGMGPKQSGGWFVSLRSDNEATDLYLILVLVGSDRSKDKFFVLTCDEANVLIEEYRTKKPRTENDFGFSRHAPDPHQDRWEKLPH